MSENSDIKLGTVVRYSSVDGSWSMMWQVISLVTDGSYQCVCLFASPCIIDAFGVHVGDYTTYASRRFNEPGWSVVA